MRRAAAIGLFAASVLISAPAAAQISIFGGGGDDASGGLFGILTKAISQREALLGNISEEKESQMGAAAADVLLGAAPLVDDPELQRYVNTVGLWIALQTERADRDWRFGVLEDDTVNAFAAPAGYVFITKGLFLVFRSEAELAGVLAHEIAHVVARHHVNAMVKQERFKFLADAAQTASGEGGLIASAAVAASKELYSKGLDKSLEFEADRKGAVVAARAGYDPYGLVHTLMTLDGAGADPEFLGFFLSTHPATGRKTHRKQRQQRRYQAVGNGHSGTRKKRRRRRILPPARRFRAAASFISLPLRCDSYLNHPEIDLDQAHGGALDEN
jgi:predicted Zn-dependent protease